MNVRVLLAALLCGVASGAHVSSRSPYSLGYGGGVTLTITGSGFSEDQFNQFDPTLGNVVKLVNEFDTIDCKVIQYLSNTEKIVCSSGKRTNHKVSTYYTIKVFVDGQEATGSQTVRYGSWISPVVERISPVWSLPGALVEMTGNFHTDRYKVGDVSNPLEDNLDTGRVLTKVYVGNVDCEMINSTSEMLYGEFDYRGLSCLITSKNIGPMNGSAYVTERGASVTSKWGTYVDSQDRLYQHHTYAGVDSISPSTGSPGGRTLISVSGVGFNPYPGATEVLVGGAECEIQTITDDTLTCLTPAEDDTSPGSRERGFRWEFWEGEYVSDITQDDQWNVLTSSHPNYTSEIKDDMLFYVDMSSPSSGQLSGYLHAPHDGEYAIALGAQSAWAIHYVATDGNPASLRRVNSWEIFNMQKDTPTYFETRFRGSVSTEIKGYMNDFTSKYSWSQSFVAYNEKHQVKLNPKVQWDTQSITPSGSPVASKLYLNGHLSDAVDVTDADQVRTAILGLVEQQCEVISSDPSFTENSGYEDDDTSPTGQRGNIVDNTEAFCGRHSFNPHYSDSKLYDENDRDDMVDLDDFPYMCFAAKGNIQTNMRFNLYFWSKWNYWRSGDVWFDHSFASDVNTWSYRCYNLRDIAVASWASGQRNDGGALKIRRVYAPIRASAFDEVYIDEFTFTDENIDVTQTRPSALESQGILISDVNVNYVENDNITSLEVEFVTSNCMGNFPLLGVTDGAANPSWWTDLDSSATSASFTVSGGSFEVNRVLEATNPVQGTWSMNILGSSITGISPRVESHELKDMIEGALGETGIYVSQGGSCDSRTWNIEWQENPGRKPVATVDDSQLSFDGESFTLECKRIGEGKIWHDPIRADFLTVRSEQPDVALRVNGYPAACLGDCTFAFDSTGVPTLSSVAGSIGVSGDHTLTIMGTDFSSSDLSDYAVTVGMADCVVSAITSTQITCAVAELSAGNHAVSVVMNPVGSALQPDPALMYIVSPTIVSVTPSTGGTGGGYLIVVVGSGFPTDLSGWAYGSVTVGGADCNITAADATSVTCTVPAGSAGMVDVSVTVYGETSTLSNGFTYDASLSASITSVSPTTSSVLGGDILSIIGTDFGDGASGIVMVGPAECVVVSWMETLITCTLPGNNPGVQDVSVYTGSQGYASGSASVTYIFKITGSSATTGSVYGGTILVIDGEGFGSNCSLPVVEIGDGMVCDITECSDVQITCITRLVSTNHVVTNLGSLSGFGVGYAWTPKLQTVREGDSVTWTWSGVGPFSQLDYNVYQTASASDKDYDGSGFHSGSPTSSGSMTVDFPHAGNFYYSGDPVYDSSVFNTVVMSGQVNVVRPSQEVNEVTVKLGDVKADYEPLGAGPTVSVDGCSTLLSTPFVDCNSTAPSAPDSDNLYFISDLCLTPTITGVSASATESITGLQGLQVRSGVTLTISGTGFGTEVCQTSVMIGPASCTVSASSDTSVTCVLDDNSNIVSLKAFPVVVTVANRGSACNSVSNFEDEGQVTVVPVVTSFTPNMGSVAGGTLVTISGSGLKSFDSQALIPLGDGPCAIDNLTASVITCRTVATPASTVTLAVYISSFNIPAFMDVADPSYTFSASATPMVTGISVSGETFTISGSSFGTSTSGVTVTVMVTGSRHKRSLVEASVSEAKEDAFIPVVEAKNVDEEIYSFNEDDDEELRGYNEGDDEMHTIEDEEPEYLSIRHAKIRADIFDKFDAGSDFWGTFTNTKARTFEESKRLGAWKIAGSNSKVPLDLEPVDDVKTRVLRQAGVTSYACTPTAVTGTSIMCTVSGIPANTYSVAVNVLALGSAALSGSPFTVSVAPTVTTISPIEGSINGGALLTITGAGFTPGDVSVTLDGIDCPLEDATTNSLDCRVPAHAAGTVTVEVISASVSATSPVDFTYSSAKTPVLTSVSPDTGVSSGMTLTLSGTGLKLSGVDPTVTVGGADCGIIVASDTSVTCTSPDVAGGSHDVIVKDSMYGNSNSDITVSYDFTVSSVSPDQAGFGGAEITVSGLGFDPSGTSTVTVCGNPCVSSSGSSSSITCIAPAYTGSGPTVTCDVEVTNPDMTSATLVSGFTYDDTLTPAVFLVTPKRGGTAGGTTLTITGSGFATSGNDVTIGGSECIVTAESDTEITCVTEAHSGPGIFPVLVEAPGLGFATTDEDGEFFYIDRWSSVYTWGGEPVPSEGQLVVIENGQTVLLDESTEVLKAIIIQGGHLIFDDEASDEIVLRAEYILIVDGGSLRIGSEEDPFMNPAVIELHGNTRSIELPFYGAKVLAVRNGSLELHGAPVPVTWTRLASTANAGDTSITLTTPVTWKAGDEIVIATTEHRFMKNENEERTIASVSGDGLTLTLTEALDYEHISIQQTLGGRDIETRAEVGLLTRNVKIRGNINSDFTEVIEACDEEWSPGQFSTQSCFNGRFGEEIGSDQFGATVMIFGKYPNQDLVSGRIEYVEVTEAGQAFQLGRYPLHFHLVGNVNTSYIRGCAVHRTYNRAVTIHAADYLTIQHNVVYNNMGHAIFTEDGIEQNNVIEYNLAIYTRSSSSLLNVDITPSSFWVVHPNNIVRHNAAAGGTHFGYWYRLERHPTGPSATNSICQNNARMGQFFNNTAHSMGRYGLWVFSMDGYFPKSGECGGSDQVARWDDFTVWRCDRGAEIVFGGALQFHNFVALDNENAGLEMVKMSGGFGEDDGPGIFDSLLVGHSALSDGSCGDETSGIIAPKQYIFSIDNTKFVNYDTGRCSAMSGCSQCKIRQGGFRVQVKGLTFDNAPNKLRFQWEHEGIWIDADGSLSGTPENNVVPSMGILPPANCQMDVAAFSVNPDVPGSVCGGLKFLRFNVKGPGIEPDSLQARDLIVSNSHGNTSVPYRLKRLTTEGWMGILYTEDTYKWDFDYSEQITNMSYDAETRFVEDDDYYYVEHEFIQRPDSFGTTGSQQNSTDALPNPITNVHGDYYWNNDTRMMTYMVSGQTSIGRTIFDDRNVGSQRNIDFEVFRCYFVDCITPTPPPVPTGRPDVTFRWSDTEAWKEVPVGSGGHPTDTTYGLPVEGDEIIIPPGMWLIVDTATPKLGRVYVYGGIEFEDSMDHTFEATIIYIQGGTVVAGFSEDTPFSHDLNIILRGSLDPNDPDNVDMPMPFGVPNVGWKAIGVFGQLTLHGEYTAKSWVKLGATASVGDTVITLAESADPSWVNQEVMITTTSKEAAETEIRIVTAVSGSSLTLDTALDYEHLSESFTLSDNSASFTMAAEVGFLSRNIRIEGNDYINLEQDSFGGRIVVSQLTDDGIDYVGQAQLHSVELKNMGQEGFTDSDDPRYSLAFVGLGVNDGSNYVKKCSFNKNYNTAIGLFGTDNVTVEDNVIYHTVGPCIRDDSSDNVFIDNLLSVMLFPGTYNGRFEEQNFDWFGAFALNKASYVVLEGNVVAGSEQAGYQTYGEMCEDDTLWQNNEVHSAIFGVLLWRKGGGSADLECRRLNNFYAWRVWDTAFYMQHYAEFLLTGVQAVDCHVGVNQIIYSPPSLSHQFLDKTGTTENSIFVGASPIHTCDYQSSSAAINDLEGHVLLNHGHAEGHFGIFFTSFLSSANMAPKHAFQDADSYPALHGATQIENVTFANFGTRSCGTDVALTTNPTGDDAVHPIFTNDLTFVDTPSDNYIFFTEPNLGRVNPADCVDMTCDGLKKVVLEDKDGSLLGTAMATATAMAEYEWDGDASHGVGDYRIPVPLMQYINGSKIPAADKFPNKGIVRDGSCTLMSSWRAWKCTSLRHRMMIIESMDSDTEIRRLSPIALIANPGTDGYVDLLNGPMDRGWCFGYTCQERISTFYSVVASNYTYEMAMTSTPPQVIRFHLLDSNPSETVLLRIFFPKTQRYDIYVDDVYIPPTNIDGSSPSYQLIPDDPNNPETFFPTHNDAVGTNYLQRAEKFLHVLLRGGHIIEIKTTPMIVLTTGIVVDPNNFFEENIVANIAAMLGVSVENIRLTNVIREDSRKRSTTENVVMEFEIASAPTENLEGGSGATDGEVLAYDSLTEKVSNLVDTIQSGCVDCNLTVAAVEIVDPITPPEEAGPPATPEVGSVVTEGELYSNQQQAADAQKLNQSLEATVYEEPSGSILDQGVSSENVAFTPFEMQPQFSALTVEGDNLESLGYASDPWMVEAVLSGGPPSAVLLGTNPVPYMNGVASFTDLSVNRPGDDYTLTFHVAYPDIAPDLPVGLNYTFRAAQKSVSFRVTYLPAYVNAETDFSIQLAVIDDDTDMPIDPSQLAGQTLEGKIKLTNKKKKGKLVGNTIFTFTDGDISEFTLNGLRLTKPGKNYRMFATAKVMPAAWNLRVKTDGVDVLPKDLIIPENPTVKEISMKGLWGKGKAVRGKTAEFANKLSGELAQKVGLAYWFDISVRVAKRPFVTLQVMGSDVDVEDAIQALCVAMKAKNIKVKINRQRFIMGALRVDGKRMKQC